MKSLVFIRLSSYITIKYTIIHLKFFFFFTRIARFWFEPFLNSFVFWLLLCSGMGYCKGWVVLLSPSFTYLLSVFISLCFLLKEIILIYNLLKGSAFSTLASLP